MVRRDAAMNRTEDLNVKVCERQEAIAAIATAASTAKPSQQTAGDRKARKRDPGSKQSRVIAMLQSPTGATIAAMMKATGWQQHSVRGFLAGVVRKRLKLKLGSKKVDGNRIYRSRAEIAASPGLASPAHVALSAMPRVKIGPAAPDRNALDVEIARLRDLDVGELRARWHTVLGRRPPPHLPRHLLFRVLAEALQRIAALCNRTIWGRDRRYTARRAANPLAAAGRGDEGLARDGIQPHPAAQWPGRRNPVCADPLERSWSVPR